MHIPYVKKKWDNADKYKVEYMIFSSPCSTIFLWITFFRDNNNPVYSLTPLFLINRFSTNKFPTRVNKNISFHLDYGVILVMNFPLFWHWLIFFFKEEKMDGRKERNQEGGKEAAHLPNLVTMQSINKLRWLCFGQRFVREAWSQQY